MEIRSFSDGTPKVTDERMVEGYASVFNQESKIMFDKEKKQFFVEIIESGSITDELLRACDIKAVLEHNTNRLLARSRNGNGSLSLYLDDYGFGYRFYSPNTPDGDFTVEMIKRGDLYGSSFAYWTNDKDTSKVTYTKKDGILLRRVHKIDKIFDVSPVTDPAYYGTDVTIRSLENIAPDLFIQQTSYISEINNLRKQI